MLTRSQTAKSQSVEKNTNSNYCISTRASARLAEIETTPTPKAVVNRQPKPQPPQQQSQPQLQPLQQQTPQQQQVRKSERISALQKPVYSVDIDFDEASKVWMENKRKMGGGTYRYK